MSGSSLRHLSVRVPWHDQRWNGTVCANPASNDACLALKSIGLTRDDAKEQTIAGQRFDEIEPGLVPPCVRERAGFLIPYQHDVKVRLQYSEWSPDHKHILPTPVRVPAWGATLVPFRWMLRENAWTIADEYGLEASVDQEPTTPEFLADTDWVQDHENQKVLLDGFSNLCREEESLVFFYAKRTPLADDDRRVVVAVATLAKLGDVNQYDYEGGAARGRIRSMVWERPFQHSLRPHPDFANRFTGGIVMPYHDILACAATDPSIDPAHFLASPPDEARLQFSYASEHVTHGTAISTLLACKTALERAAEQLDDGPWSEGIAWIDDQVNRLWRLQGPCPGLGSALSALHDGFNGTLFALSLSSALATNEDPWPLVDKVFKGEVPAPAGAPRVTGMLRRLWTHLNDKQPRRAALLRLLSRFELTKQQATQAFAKEAMTDAQLENPYILYEQTRTSSDPIGLWTIDRGLYPGDDVLRRHPLPLECGIDPEEPDQPSRLRAVTVAILEDAADAGDTLLPAERIKAAAAELPATRPVPITATLLKICEDDFKPEIVQVTVADGADPWLQLSRYAEYRQIISQAIETRLDAAHPATSTDWRQRLDTAFGAMRDGDTEEERAREEKATALATLAGSKFAVLTGPAGTGKTTVLRQLLDEPSLVGSGIVLLAPTGKARVRLGLQTERPDKAQTVAQFLKDHKRYDSQTGRYFPDSHIPRADGSTTCVIDEASMLTEDQLAAVVDALPLACRLILVGDHRQLPPIGAGRPFVDVIAHLQASRSGIGVAELTVRRRQASGHGIAPRDLACADVQLAELFSGRDLPPGEDEILNAVLAGKSDERLRLVEWSTPDELRQRLCAALQDELKLDASDLEGSFALTLGGRRGNGDYVYFDGDGKAEACESWQILTPHRAQPMGAIDLNRHIKATFRPDALRFARESNEGPPFFRFRTITPQGPERICYGDKVICLRNHERKGWNIEEKAKKPKGYLANGEIGVVIGEAFKDKKKPRRLNVRFASQGKLSYSFYKGDFSEEATPILELAYAVTVHKAQGSEFGTVFLVIPAHSRLLSREMLYTALTRQKERVVVLHQGDLAMLRTYRSPFYSETARRLTNLFTEPRMVEVPPPPGMPGKPTTRGFLEEKLIHRTARKDLVSSKSEIVIADALYEAEEKYGIRYRVEEKLIGADGTPRWPDFIIEDARHGTWYWEHCGMLDQPDYRARWERKLAWYAESRITRWSPEHPEGRLIVTHDGGGEGLDSAAIRQLIRDLFANEAVADQSGRA